MAGAPCGGRSTPAGRTIDAESPRGTPGRGGRSERSLPEDSGGRVAAVPMRAGIVVTTGSDFRRVPGAVPEAADAEQRCETHRDPGDSGAWRADDRASGGGRRTRRGAPELSSVNLAGDTRRNRAVRGKGCDGRRRPPDSGCCPRSRDPDAAPRDRRDSAGRGRAARMTERRAGRSAVGGPNCLHEVATGGDAGRGDDRLGRSFPGASESGRRGADADEPRGAEGSDDRPAAGAVPKSADAEAAPRDALAIPASRRRSAHGQRERRAGPSAGSGPDSPPRKPETAGRRGTVPRRTPGGQVAAVRMWAGIEATTAWFRALSQK